MISDFLRPTSDLARPWLTSVHHPSCAKLRIVVVEDDPLIALDLETSLLDLGYEVCACAANSLEANAMGERYRPDIVTLDLNLNDGPTGVSVAHALYSRYGVRPLVISGSITPFSIDELRATNPLGYIDKPHRLDLIEAALAKFSRRPCDGR
jgi:two-component system, response regulator PdtaR